MPRGPGFISGVRFTTEMDFVVEVKKKQEEEEEEEDCLSVREHQHLRLRSSQVYMKNSCTT